MSIQLALATSRSPKFGVSGWFTSNSISSTMSAQKNRTINPAVILKVYFYFN